MKKTKVLEGFEQWLFLDNDSNRSVEQFTGDFLIDNKEMEKWYHYLEELKQINEKSRIKVCLLVVPSKEEVLPEYYPWKKGSITPLDQLKGRFSREKIFLYPLSILKSQSHKAYSKIDTHWTGYGSYVVFKKIINIFQLHQFADFNIQFCIKKDSGDLGSKLDEKRIDDFVHIQFGGTSVGERVFWSGINNIGNISIYVNNNSLTDKKLVIFGDSFSFHREHFVKLFSIIFSRVVFVHSVAKYDRSIIDNEGCDYVICQINQRFIVQAPTCDASVWDLIQRKIMSSEITEIEELQGKIIDKPAGNTKYYYDNLLRVIHESSLLKSLSKRTITEFSELQMVFERVKNQKIYFFGASGCFMQTIVNLSEEQQRRIAGVFDNDEKKVGKDVAGVTVFSPSDIKHIQPDVIFITSFYYNEIAIQLKKITEQYAVTFTFYLVEQFYDQKSGKMYERTVDKNI